MNRKITTNTFGLAVLIMAAYFFFYIPYYSSQNMKEFCSKVPVQASKEQVNAMVKKYGFKVTSSSNRSEFIHVPPGRAVCQIKYSYKDKVTEKHFSLD
ncbi:MAG: hypothetical protein CSA79_00860 [Thiothrix nivea]|nr:MAG: hypothetical protein CSA79_00860 [Thiothrix nivea]